MKKWRDTKEQIAFALRQAGTPAAEAIRRMNVSEQTFTAGRRCMASWVSASCGGSSNSRTRTAS